MNNRLLTKTEFWALSVPSLLALIGALVHYGSWRVLWALAFGHVVGAGLKFLRDGVETWLEIKRYESSRKGSWTLAAALILPLDVYCWFLMTAVPDLVCLALAWHFRGAMPDVWAYVAVFVSSFSIPCISRVMQRRSDGGGYDAFLVNSERFLLLAAIPVSAFAGLSPFVFATAFLAYGLIYVPVAFALMKRNVRKDFEVYRKAALEGKEYVPNPDRCWFPRPGVLYVPNGPVDRSAFSHVKPEDLGMARQVATVLRVSPMAFATLALFAAGLVGLVWQRRELLLLGVTACGLVLLALYSGFLAEEKKHRAWTDTVLWAGIYAFIYFGAGSVAVVLGTGDLVIRVLVAAYLVSLLEFPARFIVRGSSEREPDAFRPLCTSLAVALAVFQRGFGHPWYLCGVASTLGAYAIALIHHFRPVKARAPSPESAPDKSGMPEAKADRRRRKRDRQISALRRSQGR